MNKHRRDSLTPSSNCQLLVQDHVTQICLNFPAKKSHIKHKTQRTETLSSIVTKCYLNSHTKTKQQKGQAGAELC